jgi:hypothetical protein
LKALHHGDQACEQFPRRTRIGTRLSTCSAIKIEAVADELIALVEEFEGTLSEGHVPPEFAERLAELGQTAERLINP